MDAIPRSYDKGMIKNHIIPYIGHVQLRQVSPAMLDNLFRQLFDKGLSNSSVRYVQRILSVSFEHARKYHYVETNPARDIITKFGKQGKTPDPYTIEQMQQFMGSVIGTEWEMPVVLAGMYGLRISEIIGLRTDNTTWRKCSSASWSNFRSICLLAQRWSRRWPRQSPMTVLCRSQKIRCRISCVGSIS